MIQSSKLIGISFALILVLGGAATARERDSAYNPKQYAYQAGYQDGFSYGDEARAQGYRHDYQSEDYRRADRGYDRFMGERDDFQKSYRNGYKAGYDDGFNGRRGSSNNGYDPYSRNNGSDPNSRDSRNGPYSRNNGSDPDSRYNRNDPYSRNGGASDFGYRDGTMMGQKDRQNGKDFRPQKNEPYEDANHGYRKEYGNKNFYKEQYRQAFVRGYEDAYGR